MKQVITRIWHGITRTQQAEAYLKYLQETGVKDYQSTPGNLGVTIWRRFEGDHVHFWTVSTWDSFESIKKFAGEDFETARYYPEDKAFLLEFEPKVIHCETFQF